MRPVDVELIYRKQREFWDQERPRSSVADRIAKIRRVHDALLANRREIRQALWADYKKPPDEVDFSEIYPAVTEARHAMRRLKRWMKPRRVSTPLLLFGSRSSIVYEPKGVVLIISPWNFPINLTIGPLISAIAAGNSAIVKPSELTPNSSACTKRILSEIFDERDVAVIEGDASVAEELLRKRFDHIFFTGSSAIGKIVMRAAADNLTSVTLELGGKSPAIVDRSADIRDAARSIAFGKFLNCGQVCIAPDYVLVDESVRDRFMNELRVAVPQKTGSLLVSERHAQRIKRLIDDATDRGAKIISGGTLDDRSMAPTILADVPADSALMREEIFGPVLPIVSYRTEDEAMQIVAGREKPLALYVFARDRAMVDRVMRATSAGGTVINDTLIHFFQVNLPFGGVGSSGMGKGHGFFGFESFSNARSVVDQSRLPTSRFLHPPYGWFKRRVIDVMLRWL